jgi:dipeptidyl aminopeptidase/acylaminoacyl peptidase
MRSRLAASAVMSLLALAPALVSGQGTPVLTFDELAGLSRVSAFAVSPKGDRVVFAMGQPDLDANRTPTSLWSVPAAGGEARRVTTGTKRDMSPKFSPDGSTIAFLSDRDGTVQIWAMPASGGEPSKITAFPGGVENYDWTQDGKFFVFAAATFPDCENASCIAERIKARDASPIRARVTERLLFRHWDSWADGMRVHVWKIPAAGGEPIDLTPGNFTSPVFEVGGGRGFAVSPEGREIAVSSNRDKNEAATTNADLWISSFQRPESGWNLTKANLAWDGSPKYSPDGRFLAYRTQSRPGFEADRFRLNVLDRGAREARTLSGSLDAWVDEFVWAPDSRVIYVVTHQDARGAILRLDLAGAARTEIWKGGNASDLAISADGKRLYFLRSTLSSPPEVWSVGTDGKDARPVTRVNDARLARLSLAAVSERFVTSADGKKIQSWLLTPPGFDAKKKYPAVVIIHGGPQSATNDAWSTRWNPQVFAAAGYVVLAPNPRGSYGFGQSFVDEITGDWGGKVYDDLMRATDDLAALPYVDAARIGAAGASYGGYMVAWIAGHTDRFKTLVCHDGIIDLLGMGLETEELWFTTYEFGGYPWSSTQYEKWNPVRSADKMKTPMLIIHGERDYRVPFGQSLQLFTALQVQGVPSKLLMFPDEGHWVLKPGNSRIWHAYVLDWLGQWLGGTRSKKADLDRIYSIDRGQS